MSVTHLKVTNREQFFFGGGKVCRLCRAAAETPKTHFSMGVEARYHTMREMLLDIFTPYLLAGVSPEDVAARWPKRLVDDPAFFRIHRLVAPTLLERAATAHHLLGLFKDLGHLDDALSPARNERGETSVLTKRSRNVVEFERLEYIGDALWGATTSARILSLFPSKDWLGMGFGWAFGILRDNIESNVNLGGVYDCLNVGKLLPHDVQLGGDKPKADIMEAICGALQIVAITHRANACAATSIEHALPSGAMGHSLHHLARHLLTELNDLTVLIFLHQILPPVLPMVRELAIEQLRAMPVHSAVTLDVAPRPPWMLSRRLRYQAPKVTFSSIALGTAPGDPERMNLPAFALKTPVAPAALRDLDADVAALAHRSSHSPPAARRAVAGFPLCHAPSICESATFAAASQLSPEQRRRMAMDSPPHMTSEDEMMLARMHPLNSGFAVNTGFVPEVVLRAERKAEAARARKRKTKRGAAVA